MSESLTPFEGENLASYEALKTAIQLADGFTLIFAVTNIEAGAQEVLRRLWREGVRYQKAWLRDPESPLIGQVLESVRTATQPVMILGLEGLTTMPTKTERSLRNLNWTRPQWTARLPQAIVFWLTTDLEATLAREAPDMWRFRSLRVEFKFGLLPPTNRALDLRKRLRTLELAPQVRLNSLIELFNLTRDQRALEDAVKLVAKSADLPLQEEFEYLRRLKFHGSDHASIAGLGPFPNLESIELEYTQDDDDDVSELIEESQPAGLTNGTFLEGLIGEKTISSLSRLPNFSHLEWTSETRRQFDGEYLIQLQKLKSLSLYMPEMRDKDFGHICEMGQLNRLSLVMTSLSGEAFRNIPKLQGLYQLDLYDSGASGFSLQFIAQLKNLRSLYLVSNSVADKDLVVLGQLPRLRRISIATFEVTEEGVAKLRKLFEGQNRKVEILFYDSE